MLFAVLTVSDRCAQGTATDTAGPAVIGRLRDHWPQAEIQNAILPDEPDQISERLARWVDQGASLILTVGGTGLGPRDRTPEATRLVLEREAPGIAEAMRAKGAAQNPMAWLSRAVAGLAGNSLILNLPGSRHGAEESLAAVLSLIEHGLETIAGSRSHPIP
jgi:molybdopterin adenylyltransferase